MQVDQTQLDRVALQVANRAIVAGAARYDRARDLPKLFPNYQVWSHTDLLARLENAIRAEKNAVRAGRWTGDLNRLIALRIALYAELGYLTQE